MWSRAVRRTSWLGSGGLLGKSGVFSGGCMEVVVIFIKEIP